MDLPLPQFLYFIIDYLVIEAREVAAARASMLAIGDQQQLEYRERVADMVGLNRDTDREEAERKAYEQYQQMMGLA